MPWTRTSITDQASPGTEAALVIGTSIPTNLPQPATRGSRKRITGRGPSAALVDRYHAWWSVNAPPLDRLSPVARRTVSCMVRIGAIVLKVSDTGRAGEFWSQALGYQRGANPDFLLPSVGGGPGLHLDATDRTHLDLWAANEDEQRAEVERLQALGATRVAWDYPEDADFVVLADPDGNLLCVVNAGS